MDEGSQVSIAPCELFDDRFTKYSSLDVVVTVESPGVLGPKPNNVFFGLASDVLHAV